MKNETINLLLDDDIIVSVRSAPPVVKPDKPEDIWLPIPVLGFHIKKLEDTTDDEFMSWLRFTMPFTDEMIRIFTSQKILHQENRASNKTKNFLFETAAVLHETRWLFGKGRVIIKKDLRWN